jgi:hypothetical protein
VALGTLGLLVALALLVLGSLPADDDGGRDPSPIPTNSEPSPLPRVP